MPLFLVPNYAYLWVQQAARETDALKEAKEKLEKQVEELTWHLQLEKRSRVICVSVMVIRFFLFFFIFMCFYTDKQLILGKEHRKKNDMDG